MTSDKTNLREMELIRGKKSQSIGIGWTLVMMSVRYGVTRSLLGSALISLRGWSPLYDPRVLFPKQPVP